MSPVKFTKTQTGGHKAFWEPPKFGMEAEMTISDL